MVAAMQLTTTKGAEMQPKNNIAARMGRWSAQHRKTAILGWIVFVVLAFMAGGKVGTDTLSQTESGSGDSGKASKLLEDAYPKKGEEAVIVQSKRMNATAPEFREVVA